MSPMNRIKCTAKQPDAFQSILSLQYLSPLLRFDKPATVKLDLYAALGRNSQVIAMDDVIIRLLPQALLDLARLQPHNFTDID